MASFIRINGKYRVTIHRKGWKAITKTFDREAHAESWSRKIERQIDERKKVGIHGKTGMTLADAISISAGGLDEAAADTIYAQYGASPRIVARCITRRCGR
jgi:ABC-type enterochelin transport system substrate-binding protein